ncbi:hypothetical protein BC835DRAFT_964840 [Cytidiella melzeri]|nr:hypothetical protein BC835DRAFT_964840 [Cytidiella melzeri]
MLFKSIATFATFALSVVSVIAAPAANVDNAVLVKKAQPQSIPQIFAGATTSLTPLTQQLQGLTASDLSVDAITPIVGSITVILNEVVTDVSLLVGQEASIVLATVDATALVTVHDLSVIVSELVHLVLTALGTVTSILLAHPFTAAAEIHSLLFEVGYVNRTQFLGINSHLSHKL